MAENETSLSHSLLEIVLSVDNALWVSLSGLGFAFLILLIEFYAQKRSKHLDPESILAQVESISEGTSSSSANSSSINSEAETIASLNTGTTAIHPETFGKSKVPTSSKTLSPLTERLSKSRNSLWSGFQKVFGIGGLDEVSENTLIEFEELLIESDLGVRTSSKIMKEIKGDLEKLDSQERTSSFIKSSLRSKLNDILKTDAEAEIEPRRVNGLPKVVLVVGVNGAGKTTTIGKLAFQYQAQGAKVLIAACDTFRAAAAGQLEIWKERANAQIEKGTDGEKPSTVAYRAVHRAKNENFDVLLIDTAGRLHTRVNLMNELSGILNIITREQEGAPHETILVVDGSSGQNALQQAREFNSVTSLSGLVVTKLDGTPKGGIVVAIKDELNIPIRYIGIGESVADLRHFDAEEFVDALLGDDDNESYNEGGRKVV